MKFMTPKIRFNIIALAAYLIPAAIYLITTTLSNFDAYSKQILTIKVSVLLSILGLILGSFFSVNASFKMRKFTDNFYISLSKTFIILATISISLQLIRYGIPLFQNNLRAAIQIGILWNIYTFSSMLGLFFSSYVCFSLRIKPDILLKSLIFLLFVLTLLTGWKGTLLNYLLIFGSYYILYRRLPVFLLFKGLLLFLVMFFSVNALRTGLYTASFTELYNYIYYGFENFVRIFSSYYSDCLHSVPLINCPFTYDNDLLIYSTFNVYSALTPLYSDGGIYLVSIVFFSFGFLLSLLKNLNNSFFISFFFYLMHYFFLIAHNGYIFNSGSFVIILIILLFVDIVRVKS